MGSKKIPVTIATEVVVKGKVVAKRLVDSIDPNILKAAVYKVEAAYNNDIMFTKEEKDELTELEITSMPHDESVMDPEWHISIVGKTGKNQPFKKAHVPIDPSKQQPAC